MIAESILNRLASRLARALAPPSEPLVPLVVDGSPAGLLDAGRARHLARFTQVFESTGGTLGFVPTLDTPLRRTEALEPVVQALARDGLLTAWRNERYAVRARPEGDIVFEIERAAARYFGVATYAVHLNGIVQRDGVPRMWIARRSAHKSIDPGQLDNVVGGGIAAGETVQDTLVREAREEAGIPRDLALQASRNPPVTLFRSQPDGLHRETIHPHDLVLPAGFVPRNDDGEIDEFRLVTLEEVAHCAGTDEGPDAMTADASLVVTDWLMRNGYVPQASTVWATLDALRSPSLQPASSRIS